MDWFFKYGNYVFIVISVVSGLYQLPKLSFRPFKKRPLILLVFCSILSFLTITEQIRKNKDEKYSGNTGIISSPVEAPEFPTIDIGGASFIFASGYNGLSILFDTNSFKLWVKDHKLYADALILSPDTSIIVRMTANEFETNSENIFDRNFDDSSLEVEDKKGNVVLQFQYKHDKIEVCGFFRRTYKGKTTTIMFYPDPNNRGAHMEVPPPGKPFQGHITPIFKYPSKLHPGERV